MAETSTHLVFVYGSLRAGQANHWLLRSARPLGRALIRGALIDLGWYPGLVAAGAPGFVVGEVYEVDDATLADLDGLEGVHRDPPLYVREEVTASWVDGFGPVWAYRYARESTGRPVPGGDWVAARPPRTRP